MTADQTAPTTENSELPSRLTGERGCKILIVDDAQFLTNGLQRALRCAGFIAVCAGSGASALRRLETEQVSVVLTDLRMPEMSGEELLEELRRKYPRLPCIVMTGYATREVINHVGQMPNVLGVLVKPLEYNRLFATLSFALELAQPAEI